MINKNEVITLENGYDYYIEDLVNINNDVYYLLFRLEDNHITEDLLLLKKSGEDLVTIDDEEEFNEVKKAFLKNNSNSDHNVPTVHIRANFGEIAPLVLMPGDPNRAKYIADNYLTDAKLVSDVRGILAYTGTYNNCKITVMAAGMGMPSAGIYYHELFKFYDVSKIIRIGTCGGSTKEEHLMDLVIADKSYTNSNFAKTYSDDDNHLAYPSHSLNDNIIKACEELNLPYHMGGVFTMDFFGPYIDVDRLYKEIPNGFDIKAEEMECFGLLHIASKLNKKAACILTIVDTPYYDEVISSEDREKGLDNMIKVALNAITKE